MQATPATSKPGDLPESNQQTSAENRKMHDRHSFRTFSSFLTFDPTDIGPHDRGGRAFDCLLQGGDR
jgi:hypothetical protein